ncbi:protein S-acyltransferase 18-like isoform X2 [Durio zibethinus]|uniref:S-acyltransferase n=1 Tax=Durio zibethinus TaxID=66656 RepID=A0A6P6B0P2_DURZI|nr:protein S-acyltransferase 18-like isoform X2 [Durio zibethinus]
MEWPHTVSFRAPKRGKETMMTNSWPSDGAKSTSRIAVQISNRLIRIRPLQPKMFSQAKPEKFKTMRIMRRHGWQRPLHPLQMVGMAVYSFLVVVFYTFLGLLLGNRIAEITVTTIFSFVALSVMFLFIRCTAIDPTDKISSRKKKRGKSKGILKLNYGFILTQIVVRFFRRLEKKILRTFIRRKYLDPWKTDIQMEPLLPFPLVMKDDAISPDLKEGDISYCSLCDFEWLNNCVGKRNYTTFILLMIFVLLMLILEGGTTIAIFIRCFADKKGIEQELEKRLYIEFPREVLATITILLALFTAYGSAAMGQLFFFHVVLIRKGMRTYDYILALKEENQFTIDPFENSDISSDDSSDFDSPEKPTLLSRLICRGQRTQNPSRVSIRIDGDPEASTLTSKKQGFHVSIDPWKLIYLSREKALLAAEKARERLMKQKPAVELDPLKPLPLETKHGPLINLERNMASGTATPPPLISKSRLPGSPRWFASPRRRFSGSPTMFSSVIPSPKEKYRSNFDLKLTEVSRELETFISRQVLCSVIKKDGSEASPR